MSEAGVVLKVSPDINNPDKRFYVTQWPLGSDVNYNVISSWNNIEILTYSQAYRIIDDVTGSIFMGVDHGSWGNVYSSDASGIRYAISLEHVAKIYPYFDFSPVRSIEGVYIANVIDNWQDLGNNNGVKPMYKTRLSSDNGIIFFFHHSTFFFFSIPNHLLQPQTLIFILFHQAILGSTFNLWKITKATPSPVRANAVYTYT